MSKPLVAIVGRPNVGKSTLFNKIIGRRIAIVEDTPGVTRDRIYGDATWLNYEFTLIDTGGIEPMREDIISVQMRRQAELAIDMAEVIIFLVDGREGITSSDEEVADMLRKSHKNVILCVNKIDAPKFEENAYEFYSLGLGEPVTVSSGQGLGLGDLLDEVVKGFTQVNYEEEDDTNSPIKIAVVGKPNVGKSSLINAILGDERTIVSNIPGTTRDSIDTPFTSGGREYVLIDTAGIRRKRAIEDESIERYSVIRSLGAIRRADVAVIVVDADQELSEQDVRIAGYVHEEGKASVLIVNKWDLIEKDTHTMDKFKRKLVSDLAFMSYVPMLFISAKTGQRVKNVMDKCDYVYEKTSMRIPTGMLNDAVSEAISITEPPSDKGRRLKIFYATQVSVRPPTFVIKVNDPELMHFSYERYLENYIRKTFSLDGTPVKMFIRSRGEGD